MAFITTLAHVMNIVNKMKCILILSCYIPSYFIAGCMVVKLMYHAFLLKFTSSMLV